MISTLIVLGSLLLALLFSAFYFWNEEFRNRVEQPKYEFLQQVASYDRSRNSGNRSNYGARRQAVPTKGEK